MKGTRPLNNGEIRRVSAAFSGTFEVRNRTTDKDRPLFPSRNRNGSVAMNRQTAHEMLKKAYEKAGLNGKLAMHSLRKSFAQRVYEHSGDIYLVQELLGHKNVSTTQKYIGVNYATARQAVETMALGHQRDRRGQVSDSIPNVIDSTAARASA